MRAYININRQTLLNNYEKITSKVYPKKVFVVLKANAYGHGLSEMAKLFSTVKNPSFVVATLEEALFVRKALVFNPLLLLENTTDYKMCMNMKLNIAVHSLDQLKELTSLRIPLPIHLNINTGLNRDGIELDEVDNAIQSISNSNLRLKGIYTHHSDPTNIVVENEKFKNLLPKFTKFKNLVIHTGSSSSLDYPDDFTNAVRVGGSIYGLYKNETITTSPALELLSPIYQKKKVNKGENVGYGNSNKAPQDGFIYLLPIGYKDGFSRSRKAIGYLDGEILVQVGQTMMDHIILFSKKDLNTKKTVELIGQNMEIHELAKLYKTIPYEITTTLNERLRRNYQ